MRYLAILIRIKMASSRAPSYIKQPTASARFNTVMLSCLLLAVPAVVLAQSQLGWDHQQNEQQAYIGRPQTSNTAYPGPIAMEGDGGGFDSDPRFRPQQQGASQFVANQGSFAPQYGNHNGLAGNDHIVPRYDGPSRGSAVAPIGPEPHSGHLVPGAMVPPGPGGTMPSALSVGNDWQPITSTGFGSAPLELAWRAAREEINNGRMREGGLFHNHDPRSQSNAILIPAKIIRAQQRGNDIELEAVYAEANCFGPSLKSPWSLSSTGCFPKPLGVRAVYVVSYSHAYGGFSRLTAFRLRDVSKHEGILR